ASGASTHFRLSQRFSREAAALSCDCGAAASQLGFSANQPPACNAAAALGVAAGGLPGRRRFAAESLPDLIRHHRLASGALVSVWGAPPGTGAPRGNAGAAAFGRRQTAAGCAIDDA